MRLNMKIGLYILMFLAILSACSRLTQEVKKEETKLKIEKPKDPLKSKRKRHKFGDHMILERLRTSRNNLYIA